MSKQHERRPEGATDLVLGLSLDQGPGVNIRANPRKTAWTIRRRKQPLTLQPWMNVETPRGFVRSRRQPVRTFRTVNGKVPGRWDQEEMAIAEPYDIFKPELSPRSLGRFKRLEQALFDASSSPRSSDRVTPIRQRHPSPRRDPSPRRHPSPRSSPSSSPRHHSPREHHHASPREHHPPREHHHHSPRRHHHPSPREHHHTKKKSFFKKILHRLIGRKGGKKSKISRKKHRRRTRKN